MRLRSLFALLTVAVAVTSTDVQAQKKKGSRDLITRDELMESAFAQASLMEAVHALRPRFLEGPRGVRSMSGGTGMGGGTVGGATTIPVAVVLDGKILGEVDVLRTIQVSAVDEVRYMEPSKAGTEFGNAAGGGAIVVKTFVPRTNPKVIVKDDTVQTKRLR